MQKSHLRREEEEQSHVILDSIECQVAAHGILSYQNQTFLMQAIKPQWLQRLNSWNEWHCKSKWIEIQSLKQPWSDRHLKIKPLWKKLQEKARSYKRAERARRWKVQTKCVATHKNGFDIVKRKKESQQQNKKTKRHHYHKVMFKLLAARKCHQNYSSPKITCS